MTAAHNAAHMSYPRSGDEPFVLLVAYGAIRVRPGSVIAGM